MSDFLNWYLVALMWAHGVLFGYWLCAWRQMRRLERDRPH